MRWVEVSITTAPPAVEAIANILLECRTGGIVEEHPFPGVVALRGYLPVGPAAEVTLAAIARRINELPAFGLDIGAGRIDTLEVEDSGWANAWKMHFKPFAVGAHWWIKPTWDEQPAPAGRVVIELDPGMAFGSGLHPSTQLCLRVLEERVVPGARVIDVGTGSGILAVAAAKLQAASVLAVDSDPIAVAVARQNAAHNGVASTIDVREGSLLDGAALPADLITANLTAEIHFDLLPTARSHLVPCGVLVASGIIEDRVFEVRAVARAAGFQIAEERKDGEWRCLVLTHGNAGTRERGNAS
ncbi:MAG TPA: 50S ribosomal protein L11 methyltransferase [bacterium]|jgi:ribosomal protein L11 methyltransferase|nr:50S ribosomal protein L11 methyltransferase [bacterium]